MIADVASRYKPLHYHLPTAVTFFLAGLGAGSLLTLILAPREDETPGHGHIVAPTR
jgi:hypothetical protein